MDLIFTKKTNNDII